jgi:hypothetical protein
VSPPLSPLPRLAASFAFLVGVFIPTVFVISSVTDGGRLRPDDVVVFTAEGVFCAVLMVISAVVVRRRRDDVELVDAQRRAIRERRLPDDVDPDVWLPLMSGRLVGDRGRRWGTVGLAAVLAALSVLCFVFGHQAWWWLFTAYFVVGGTLLGTVERRRSRATELLVDELVLRSGGGEAPSSGPTRHPAAP